MTDDVSDQTYPGIGVVLRIRNLRICMGASACAVDAGGDFGREGRLGGRILVGEGILYGGERNWAGRQ